MALAERCIGSGAQATPMNSGLDVLCLFCEKVLTPVRVLLKESGEMIPFEQVKNGDIVLIGVLPDHEE